MENFDKLGIEELSVRLNQLSAAGEQLHTDMRSAIDAIMEDVHLNRPRLAVPASEEQCVEAVEALLNSFPQWQEEWRVRRSGLSKRLKRQGRKIKKLTLRLAAIEQEPQNESDAKELVLLGVRAAVVSLAHESKFALCEDMAALETYLRQGMIHEMVNGQPQELQEWYFSKYFANHVRAIWHTLPVVRLSPKRTQLSGSISIPLEIMTMIFSCCDVESSVALYHVNSEWHTAFKQQPDTMWCAKMKKRNPWIEPEPWGLHTWSECVFLFVRRLQSNKWKSVGSLDDIQVTATPVHSNSMAPWGEVSEQDLIPDFQFLIESQEEDDTRNRLFVVPESVQDRPLKVVNQDESGTVIKYKGVRFTLSPRFDESDIRLEESGSGSGNLAVYVTRCTIQVYFRNGKCLLMSRNKPHYKQGIFFRWKNSKQYSLDGLFVRERSVQNKSSYSFGDFASKQMIEMCRGDRDNARPVAFVNGLVWWSLADGTLVPALFDLQSPGKVFYCPDRALVGVPPNETFVQQCDFTRGWGHLLFYENTESRSISIVDLASGCLTSLEPPQGWKGPVTMTPGFEDGLFEVWCQKDDSPRAAVTWLKMEDPARREEFAASEETPVSTGVRWKDMCVTI